MGQGTEELRLERLQLVGVGSPQPAGLALRHQLNIILEYCYTGNLAMSPGAFPMSARRAIL